MSGLIHKLLPFLLLVGAVALIMVVVSYSPTTTAGSNPGADPTAAGLPDGVNVSLHGRRVFPADNLWNRDISQDPVDPNSDTLIAAIGAGAPLHPDFGSATWNGGTIGDQYIVVHGDQPRVPITFADASESDPGPYPIPPDAPIEGGPNGGSDGDRHVLVIDVDHWMLYELFRAFPVDGGKSWNADSGAIFDLNTGKDRPEGWTSADAAGLPVFPGLVRYDEAVESGHIDHALRFTVEHTRHAYVPPARHFASGSYNPKFAPMGMRVRLKASVDVSDYPPDVQAILNALKKYGMIVADNGGNWFISGTADPRWNDDELHTLTHIHGGDLEVIQMPTPTDSAP
jgi:hypothetical protein